MAQTIKLKRSAQSGASGIPSTSDLALGEVGINTYHGKMYIKKDDGTESIVEVGDTSGYLPLSGGTLTGNLTTSADIKFGDDDKALFGAGNDLKIYHSANNQSYIHEANADGSLFILGTHIYLQNASGQDALNLINGDAYIKSGGQTKLQTTSTGIDVTGSVVADGLTVNGDITLSGDKDIHLTATNPNSGSAFQYGEITFGDSTTGQFANHAKIISKGGYAADTTLEFHTSTNNSSPLRMNIASNGDISFYNDSANQGLFFDSSASSLGIGTTAVSSFAINDLVVGSGSSANGMTIYSASTSEGIIRFADGTSGSQQYAGQVKYNHSNNSLNFYTNGSGTIRLALDSSGNATFSNSLEVNNHRYFDSDYNVTYYRKANHTTLGYQLHRDNGKSYYEWNTGGTHSYDFQFVSNNSPVLSLATNGNVNIPNGSLMVGSTTAPSSQDASANNLVISDTAGNGGLTINTPTNAIGAIHFSDGTSGADRYRGIISYSHSENSMRFHTDTARAMTIDNSGRVGIGTNIPSSFFSGASNLVVSGGSGNGGITIDAGTSSISALHFADGTSGSEPYRGYLSYNHSSDALLLGTSGVERMTIGSSGSVGIGVVPSANSSYMVALQLGEQANLYAHTDGVGAGSATYLSNNITHNSGFKYINADAGSQYTQASGAHKWSSFASGSAGGAATENTRMTLTSGGDLLVGKTASSFTTAGAEVQPSGRIELTRSGELMNLNRLGSDGILIRFFGSSALVGSIGSASGQLGIDSQGTRLNLQLGGTTKAYVRSSSLNPSGDGTFDLGESSERFKDLYLSNNATAQKLTLTKDPVGTYTIEVDGTNTGQPNLIVKQSTSERLRIDNQGRVGIGTSAPAAGIHLTKSSSSTYLRMDDGSNCLINFSADTNTAVMQVQETGFASWKPLELRANYLVFKPNNTETMRLTSTGLGIGTSSPTMPLSVKAASNAYAINMHGRSDGYSEIYGSSSDGSTRYAFLQTHSAQTKLYTLVNTPLLFGTNSTERMRLSGGNLLVGKTSAGFANTGHELRGGGSYAAFTRDGGTPVLVNRKSSDGTLVEYMKDGTTVGSIGVDNGDNLTISGNSSHAGLNFSDAAVNPYKNGNYANGTVDLGEASSARWRDLHLSGSVNIGDAKTVGHGAISLKYDLVYMTAGVISPADDDGSDNDNSVDLGKSAARFNDIFATNGTIQTSDRNEKQDIESLTEAEERVAIAAKSLLKKFRWKSAVEDKGDDARIHFGIIAQDLQAAFEAEGLDAGRYGMFTSNTWTNEDGEEQTRMGVRYSELLAFIISAI